MHIGDKQPITELPGLGPEAYARWRTSRVGAVTERLERRLVLDLAGDVHAKRVLDLGCGDGDLAVELAKLGGAVTGADASPSMISAARLRAQREGVSAQFRIAQAKQLPFADAEFDVIAAVTILCFVDDVQPVFREMARVLRPGGHLVIGELGKWSTWALARRIRGWFGSPLWRRARFRTPGEMRALALQAGLHTETVRGAIYYPRWGPAAKFLGPYDETFSRLTLFGAAFLALRAVKPG